MVAFNASHVRPTDQTAACIRMFYMCGTCEAFLAFHKEVLPMPIYVIQVSSGEEQRACQDINRFIPSNLVTECFVPTSERPYHRGNAWSYVRQPMFPGYVFVDTPDVVRFQSELGKVPRFTRVLGNGDACVPLNADEEAWLQAVTSRGSRTLEMSRGIIKSGELVILSGPLMGRTAQVKKVDRHKRLAYVEVEMLGRKNLVKLGLEVTEKIA